MNFLILYWLKMLDQQSFWEKIVNFYLENLKSSDFYKKMNEHVRITDR